MRNIFLICLIVACSSIASIAQSGGTFSFEKSVRAGGGDASSGGTFRLGHTSGQPVTDKSTNGPYSLQSGFWQADPPSAPTAAGVSISGRVRTPDGRGLVRATISIMDSSGSVRTTVTGPMGFYRFDDLEVGQSFIISVTSKRFQFAPRFVMLLDSVSDADFAPL